jgi:predicted NBD/HSP70 family sugar kinase
MGIVTNGLIYRGSTGGARIGHIVVDRLVGCGNRGCLETFVSEPWLMRRAGLNGLNVDNPDDLIALAYADHPIARDMLIAAGRALGQAVANLVNLFNPALIIISGEGVRAGSLMFDTMRATMARHMFAPLAEKLEIRLEPLSEDTWARGAASLVLNNIFSVPTLS